MSRRIILAGTVILLLIVGLAPVLSMLVKSLFSDGRFSTEAYQGLFTSHHQWTLMGHSLSLSLLTMILTVIMGVPLGILLGKSDLPLRRFFIILFVIPLLIPPYITAVSWVDLLSGNGLLTGWMNPGFAGQVSRLLFGLPGCVLVLFATYLPIPMILTIVFLRTIHPGMEEAGRLVSEWNGVVKKITLPLILPGVFLAALLVFLLSFGEFGVPNFLRYTVFPVESFTQFSAFYDFKAATAATIPLAVVTFLLLVVEARFLREKTYLISSTPEARQSPIIELKNCRTWLLGIVALLGFVIVILPITALIFQSGNLSIYKEALRQAGDSLVRSLLYAGLGATFLTIVGFFIGYLIQTKAWRFWKAIDSVTVFLFALPGTVIGIGLISLWNTPKTNFIYGTPLIILFGYLAKYTALTSRISVTQLAQIPPTMDEAARIAGAGWIRRMILITAPLAKRGLVAAWLAGYVFSLRDTSITMLVYPPGHDTLPVRIFTLMANGSPELIAALSIIMIVATLLPTGIFWMISERIDRPVIR
ncbi:MAG: iron ABC transporter permease [FCB group bacterium]|nr:iron ABC transporter permease [FCB group bacterium]